MTDVIRLGAKWLGRQIAQDETKHRGNTRIFRSCTILSQASSDVLFIANILLQLLLEGGTHSHAPVSERSGSVQGLNFVSTLRNVRTT